MPLNLSAVPSFFLARRPAQAKSTLTTFWEYLSRQDAGLPEIQTLPMDGFHYYKSGWLEAHHLRACKGAPETFDVDKLAENLRLVRAGVKRLPQYDRQRTTRWNTLLWSRRRIVIVEGNWLPAG